MFGLHDKNKADVSSFGTGDSKINKRYSVPHDCTSDLPTNNNNKLIIPSEAPGCLTAKPPRVSEPGNLICQVIGKQHVLTINAHFPASCKCLEESSWSGLSAMIKSGPRGRAAASQPLCVLVKRNQLL